MAWGIDARLKLPQGHVNGDAMLSFRLQLVQHPGTFEGALARWEAWGQGAWRVDRPITGASAAP